MSLISCGHVVTQVTEKLMEAEEKKLKVLKFEIEAGRHGDSAATSSKVELHTFRLLPYMPVYLIFSC